MSTHRGLVLQSSFRLQRGVPVVHLFGRLEDGRTFEVRDRRERPHFWIAAPDGGRARALGFELHDDGRHTSSGGAALRVRLREPAELARARERLEAEGVRTYEADVRFLTRYLVDRDLRAGVELEGEAAPGEHTDVLFWDPRLSPAMARPALRLCSFDIETDLRGERLLSIALEVGEVSEVHLLTPAGMGCPAGAVPHGTERELLQAFAARVRALDPDVLTGWNVIDFDLAVLGRAARRVGAAFELGRGPGALRVEPARTRWLSSRAHVPGRVVCDGIALVRGAFLTFDEYNLDFVARAVLGEGKLLAGSERHEALQRLFEEDRERFVLYNRTDARLVRELLDELALIPLAVERSLQTGMTLDRVGSSVAAFEHLYLCALGRRGIVVPSMAPPSADDLEPQAGGHVLEPEPGLYENVMVFDFKSLYPSIIRTFGIDPLGHVRGAARDPALLVAPNGAAFRREPAVLPQILDGLFPLREAARAAGEGLRSHAIKILMNSFYGVLGTPACRFFDAEVAGAITGFGRELLLWTKARAEAHGHRVLYGDTDSLFVVAGTSDAAEARRVGEALAAALNAELAVHVEEKWRARSRLELSFATLYLRLFLPPMRHSAAGARKRYAGLVQKGDAREVVFTGMEVVRRDATPLAKRAQRELYARLFDGAPVEDHLRELVRALRAGELDHELVYRKGLRKELGEYTATTPPHVAAARKLHGEAPRVIAYVMTVAGPEPEAERRHALDREHYVQKQLRPVAEPVLAVLGLDFDRVIGGAQLRLF